MEFWLRILTYSLPAGRIMGIPLRINWLLLLYIPFLIGGMVRGVWGGGAASSALVLGIGVIYFAVLYGSVLLHELGHAWGMHLVGESCQEIHLTPIGGLAIGGGGNHSPRTELIVVGLGPAVSAALALLGWGLLSLLDTLFGDTRGQGYFFAWALASSLYGINLMLFLFNMLMPIFPLDSAKIIRALLSLRFSPDHITYRMAHFGIGLGVVVLLASLFQIRLPGIGFAGPMLWLIALLGIQSCMYVLRALEVEQTYTTYDKWSSQPIYFDSDIIARAGQRFRSELGPFGRLVPGGRRTAARRARTQPVPIKGKVAVPVKSAPRKSKTPTAVRLVVPDPERLTDPDEIRMLMDAAAEAEDFAMAARLKRRLREVTSEEKR